MTIGTRIIRPRRGTAVSCTGRLASRPAARSFDDASDNLDRGVAKIETWMRGRVARSIALSGRAPHGMSLAVSIAAPRITLTIENAFDIPGFVPEHVRPLFREDGPFRWAARSGDPEDIHATNPLALEMSDGDDPRVREIASDSDARESTRPTRTQERSRPTRTQGRSRPTRTH